MSEPLEGKVALVAGATRGGGRGIAVALGEAGATVYATGRSTRERRSEVDRPETIEETAELVTAAGGEGIAVAGRPPRPRAGRARWSSASTPSTAASTCSSTTSGAPSTCSSGTRRSGSTTSSDGLRLLRLAIDTHLITSHHALPLLVRRPGGLVVEVTDGTADYNADHYRDLRCSTTSPRRRRSAWRGRWRRSSRPHGGTAVALTPGWMRSEEMLEHPRRRARRTGATRPSARRTSASPRRRASSAARSRRSPPTPTRRAGTASRCRAASSRRSTASPTSTARGPTAGATWSRSSSARARPPGDAGYR